MKILLVGDFSNVHATLASALRRQGYEVCVMSNGDGWKNYPRDIDIRWNSGSRLSFYMLLVKLFFLAKFRLKGYDIVQYINPAALCVKQAVSIWFFRELRKNNKVMVYGCMGDDFYTEMRIRDTYTDDKGQVHCKWLEYNDDFAGGKFLEYDYNLWKYSSKMKQEPLWRLMIAHSDCLIASPVDTYLLYHSNQFSEKLHFINFPIQVGNGIARIFGEGRPIRVLVGVQKKRDKIKGTDVMLPLFIRLARMYPDRLEIKIVENVPFAEYVKLLDGFDLVVDQLYSICPAMNALEAMNHGAVVVSGGEPAFYDFLGEKTLRPIVNLRPFEDANNIKCLEELVCDTALLEKKSRESLEFVQKYCDADKVATQYIAVWQKYLQESQMI